MIVAYAPDERALALNRRALRQKTCVLAFERFGYAGAPALGDGLRRWIGEDILFTVFQAIEDSRRN